MCKYTTNTFYSGTRKFLGKQIIHSLHIRNDLLFAGGSSVDAVAGKVCNSHIIVVIVCKLQLVTKIC